MFRSSRQSSAKQNNISKQESSDKQKQKKKLSFKDPEVEKPRGPLTPTAVLDPAGVRVPSLEDLKLEDQALIIARNVGYAFVKPQADKSTDSLQASSRVRANKGLEDYIREDSTVESSRLKPRTEQDTIPSPRGKEQEYLEALSPIKPGPTAMRCPVVEFPPESPQRNSSEQQQQQQPQQRLPTVAHHQIQLLSYQLEQQRQQTQTAMYQIQLLKDQLEAESAARYKAQVHNYHLMMQNKELLDHIQRLFHQVQDLERKLEHQEKKSAVLQSPTEERNQVSFGMQAPSNVGSRRNSSQSLWSSTPSLNPMSYNPSRRVSATSLVPPQLDPKPGEGSRRGSIRDDTSSRFSNTFDTDWRYRRRGSSSTFSSATSLTKNRASESNLTLNTGLTTTSTDAPRSPTMSLSIPELRLTLDTSSTRSDGATEEVSRISKDKLAIGEPPKDRAASPSSLRDDQSTNRSFKPIQIESSSLTQRPIRTIERDSYESDSELLNKRKPSKPLGPLSLFNS